MLLLYIPFSFFLEFILLSVCFIYDITLLLFSMPYSAGNQVLAGELDASDAAFTDVDIYTTSLSYHNKIKHQLYDNGHEVPNAIKQTLIYIGDHAGKKLKFTPKAREYELSVGRFKQLAPDPNGRKYPQAPWVASTTNQEAIDKLTTTLKVPDGWPGLRKIFKHKLFMKSSEHMLLAGAAGAYLLRTMDIDDAYKEMFIDFFYLLERYKYPMHVMLYFVFT